ncbi:hypothetical protein CJF30_00011307 [Rutstroemia sp. NJR-2017a BBW]|nr:hypothetical protein CJF30_00011307 [Rutstroemia sp. NJR-2017a BBW]
MRTNTLFVAAATFLPFTQAYLENPPTTAASDTVQDCSYWDVATSSSTCANFATTWSISLADFNSWNPSVGTSCKLTVGNSYCIERNYGNPPAGTTTSTAKPTSTTSAGNGVTTPSPIQSGMTTSCNSFYITRSGDDCAGILSKFGLSLAQFYAWNPAVGSTCTGLWLDTYVCVGAIGFVTSTITKTSSAPVTTTAAGNGISTPTPIQTGMATNCNTFYLVKSGDECDTIASSKGISLPNFYRWNPAVGSSCGSLWLDIYVCVNVVGGTTSVSPTSTQKPTTTAAGNGIATPTPIQTDMTTSCKKFHLVASGDECGVIATNAGITLANFYKYNPGIGSTCGSLWLGYYVCIGV